MAIQTVAHHSPVVQSSQPLTKKAPRSFQEAARQGWVVVSDTSALSVNQDSRTGKLTMQKKGCPGLLEVEYVGTPKGYRFTAPKFVA